MTREHDNDFVVSVGGSGQAIKDISYIDNLDNCADDVNTKVLCGVSIFNSFHVSVFSTIHS